MNLRLKVANFLHLTNKINNTRRMIDSIKVRRLARAHATQSFDKYPSELFIMPTTACNFNCKFCYRDDVKGEFLDLESIKKLHKPIQNASLVDFTGWGEPFLHKDILAIINFLADTCTTQRHMHVTTNGSMLTQEHAKAMRDRVHHVVVSLNAATSDTYQHVTKHGNFEKTLKRLDSFASGLDKKDRSRISLSFVTAQYNYLEMPQFVRLANELGIGSVFFTPVLLKVNDFPGNTLLEIKEEYNAIANQAEDEGRRLSISVGLRYFNRDNPRLFEPDTHCQWPFTSCFIQWDGSLGVCCFHGSHNCIKGNAFDNFEDMWFSEQLTRLRKSRYYKECRQCSMFNCFNDPKVHTIKDGDS